MSRGMEQLCDEERLRLLRQKRKEMALGVT